jgi:hypothetical protein
MGAAQGEQIAGFILITGIDGTRYAVRQHAVAIVADADEARDETMIHLHGGTVVRVPCSLDEVLAWLAWRNVGKAKYRTVNRQKSE